MASIINAATSGGLISTADTSGILQLQTAGTTAVTVDASQNVTLVGSLTATTGAFTTVSATGVTTLQAGTAALPALTTTGDTNTGIFFPAADSVATTVAGVEGTRLTSTGLGIGTSSPVANFRLTTSVSADTTAGVYIENTSTGTSASAVARYKNSGTVVAFTGVGGTGRSSYAGLGANVLAMYTDSNAGLALTVDNSGGSITFNTNSTEGARIDAGGRLLVGLTSANTSGGKIQVSNGITFPATQVAVADANTLDDYEEGTWTPSIGGTATYNFQFGKYTKVGRNVTIEFGFQVNSFGTGSATEVFGLPFSVFTTDGSESYAFPVAYLANSAISVTFATGYSGGGTSLIFGSTNAAVATFGLNSAIFQASTRVHVCGTYFTTT